MLIRKLSRFGATNTQGIWLYNTYPQTFKIKTLADALYKLIKLKRKHYFLFIYLSSITMGKIKENSKLDIKKNEFFAKT